MANYLRGSSKTSNPIIEFILDILSISIIIIRLGMQTIRYLIILYVLAEIFEWVWESSPYDLDPTRIEGIMFDWSDPIGTYTTVVQFILDCTRYVFYYFHFFIFMIIQSSSFFLISF